MSLLRKNLKPLNAHPVAGPGRAADKADLDVDLQPGSAVGMSLVTGDMDITGVGTVTYRRGDKIVAFGHPMLELGAIDAPLTSAYVYDVFPSYLASSKMAAPIKPIGRIYQDRPWSVAGEIGKSPEMIPVTVHINDRSSGRKRDFQAKVINHPLFSDFFTAMTAAEGIYQTTGTPRDATAKVKVQVVADEVGTITRENVFFNDTYIDFAAVSELEQILTLLRLNPFYPVGIKKVDMWVDITSDHQTAKLERIFLKEGKFEPGDTVEVGVVLRPFKGEKITKTVKLELPKNMPTGRMSLQVFGGRMSRGPLGPQDEQDSMYMPRPPGTAMPKPTIENLQQLIEKFLEREKNNELVAKIVFPTSVPSIAGEKLSGLPPSIAEAMESSKTTMLGSEREDVKEVLPTDWVIFGSQRLSITVEKVEKSEKKSRKKKAPEPSPNGPPEPDMEGPPEGGMDDEAFSLGQASLSPQYGRLASEGIIVSQPDEKHAETESAKPGEDDEKAEKKTTPPAEEKPVGRSPAVWKQTARTEFLTGTLTNSSATTGDLLTLSSSLQPLQELSEAYVWCLLPDGEGGIYAGTGNHGIIYKVSADGAASVFYDSEELEIHSLAMDSAGNLHAGTSPNGIIYKINPEGKAEVLLDAEEKYIVALSPDSKGNVYAATGDKCKVYKVSPDGEARAVLDSSEFHALSLAVDEEDNVYVGTGSNGIIYRISESGNVSVLYDAEEPSVTALAVNSDGVLLAGTSPKGVIYELARDATPKAIYEKAGRGISGISADALGNVYAANATSIFKITADETVCTLPNDRDLQFLSLALGSGRLYAGTGNIGSIYHAEIGKTIEGTYESPIHDGGLTSNWGVIEWTADLPKGTSATLQTRTGYVAEPDSTWSGWSASYGTPGSKITSPTGRYIQYLATLKTEDVSASPKLKDVSIVYLPNNQSPKVTLASPKGGEKWSKEKTIKWTASDPDKDSLTYELFYSTDDGTTWEPLSDKIKPETPECEEESREAERPAKQESPEDSAANIDPSESKEALAQMADELSEYPEISQEMTDQILAEAAAMIEAQSEEPADDEAPSSSEDSSAPAEKPAGNSTKQTTFSWDTGKFEDGVYLIKVVASDKLSNPVDAMSGDAVSEAFTVTNQAPKVHVFNKTLTVQTDKSVRVEGIAYHDLVGIAGVQYKVGSGDWAAAAAADGIFDSDFESVIITTEPLEKGKHTIEVKAFDQAGNCATTETAVSVE